MTAIKLFLPLLSAGALLSGCASIVSGQNQPLSVTTPGCDKASCELHNDEGKWYVPSTPGTVTVNRSYADLVIRCSKDDGPAATASVKSTTKGMAFGNIIFGGVIGAGVDMASGAAYDYPNEVSIPMTCGPDRAKAQQGVAQKPGSSGIKLGCTVKSVTPDIALAAGLPDPTGVLVTSVAQDSLAQVSNLSVGDILVKLNGESIADTAVLRELLKARPVDGRFVLTAYRERQLITLELRVPDEGEL